MSKFGPPLFERVFKEVDTDVGSEESISVLTYNTLAEGEYYTKWFEGYADKEVL